MPALPKSPEELQEHINSMDEFECSKWAVSICETVIASDLFGESGDVWLVRQLLKYVPEKKYSSYTNYILANQSSSTPRHELVKTWLGSPSESEGAVILMENMFNEDGWTLILSSNQKFTLSQRIRILDKIQKSKKENIFRKIFYTPISNIDKYTNSTQYHLESAITKWKTPYNWPGLNRLDDEDKSMLWSIYAYMTALPVLSKLAETFNMKEWLLEQELNPNNDYSFADYKDRYDYIYSRLRASKKLDNTKCEPLPHLEVVTFG